jgi:hypothetical protein
MSEWTFICLRLSEPTSLGSGLASDLGEGILSQTGIENGIGNLVTVHVLVSMN